MLLAWWKQRRRKQIIGAGHVLLHELAAFTKAAREQMSPEDFAAAQRKAARIIQSVTQGNGNCADVLTVLILATGTVLYDGLRQVEAGPESTP